MFNKPNVPTRFYRYGRDLTESLGINLAQVECEKKPESYVDIHICLDKYTHNPNKITRSRKNVMVAGDFSKINKHDLIRSFVRFILY